MKTNATRILDRLGIAYQLREYAVDPGDLSAETVAAKIGLPAEQALVDAIQEQLGSIRQDSIFEYFYFKGR